MGKSHLAANKSVPAKPPDKTVNRIMYTNLDHLTSFVALTVDHVNKSNIGNLNSSEETYANTYSIGELQN